MSIYYELFIGSGSVLLAILENIQISGEIWTNDCNAQLINFYHQLRDYIKCIIITMLSMTKRLIIIRYMI